MPVSVSGLVDAVNIAAGDSHTCAVRRWGSVVCWGGNAGSQHTCVARTSGASACWGGNHLGQLGSGTMTDSAISVAVSDLTGALEVAAGPSHMCAQDSSGSVLCRGLNSSGQLGDGSTADSPIRVTSLL